jgi:hypothetical protein
MLSVARLGLELAASNLYGYSRSDEKYGGQRVCRCVLGCYFVFETALSAPGDHLGASKATAAHM